jgi:hypothetical protein
MIGIHRLESALHEQAGDSSGVEGRIPMQSTICPPIIKSVHFHRFDTSM